MSETTPTAPTWASQPGGARGESRIARLDLALSILLAISTVVVWGPLVGVGLNLSDEGWLVTAVDRLVGGERLYADIYRSYAPGLYWLFAAIAPWFEGDLIMIRWVWLGGLVAIVVGSYRLARSVSPAWAAFAAALVLIFLPAPSHKTFVPLCYLASLFLCRRFVEKPTGSLALLTTGIGFGVVGLIRQEAAAFGLLIAVASLIVTHRRTDASIQTPATTLRALVTLGAGVAVPWIPVVAKLGIDGALVDAFEQLVVTGARGNAAMALPFPAPGQILTGPGRLVSSLFFLPGIAMLAGLFLWWQLWHANAGSKEAILVAQWTAMAALVHTLFASRSDLAHLLQTLVAPTLIFACLAGWSWRSGTDSARWPVRAVSVAVALWLFAAASMLNDLPRQYALLRSGESFSVRNSRVTIHAAEAATLRDLVSAIDASTMAGDAIFVAPYSPGIYHLSDRMNPSRHGAVLPGYASEEIQAEIVEALERSQTRLIVLERIDYDGRPERRLGAYAPTLVAYVRANYTVLDRIGRFSVLKRR